MLEDKIKSLIKIIEGTEVNEIEISSFWGAQKIRLQKSLNNVTHEISQNYEHKTLTNREKILENDTEVLPSKNEVSSEVIEAEIKKESNNHVKITAPLVGTFYQSSKPGAEPFIKKGDIVKEGQVICIIEAMKIFNEIESEVSGKIIEISIEDSSPVEYGQVLMLVDSNY